MNYQNFCHFQVERGCDFDIFTIPFYHCYRLPESLNDACIIGEIGTFFLFVSLFDELDIKDLRRLHSFIVATLYVSSAWRVTDKTEGIRNR